MSAGFWLSGRVWAAIEPPLPKNQPGTRRVDDLTDATYLFEFTTSPNVIWMNLSQFNLAKGSPILLLDSTNMDLVGNVTAELKAGKIEF